MKIPYALVAAVKVEQRHKHMAYAVSLGLPRLRQLPLDDRKTLTLACYGPSLKDTWQDMRHPIMGMSGATRWLAERGVICDYHVDMDPRPNKVYDINPPVPGVHYLMASVCVPEVFDALKDEQVTLWHTFSGTDSAGNDTYKWVGAHDEGALVVHGGSTIGLTAFHLGGVLGFRHFEVHGMDGSFADDARTARHAGPHFGTIQQDGYTWNAEGKTYQTSRIMANACAETINTLGQFPFFCVFHGEGLTQALLREANIPNACTAQETEKAEKIRKSKPVFLKLPPVRNKRDGQSFWDALLSQDYAGDALVHVLKVAAEAETRRPLAGYNTGTVPIETALLLRLLCLWHKPDIVVEVGTFIGTSALSMEARHIYTCDRDNDCVPSSPTLTTFPKQTSTQMLQALVAKGLKADLFFFDGRIQDADVPLIMQLATPRTIFAFDDCNGNEKGVLNVTKLRASMTGHALMPPHQAFKGRTTLAAILPMSSD